MADRLLGEIVAVVLETVGVGTPILVHFDEELEEYLFLEEVLDVLACLRADALEGRTGFTDDDAFLGIAFAVDDCGNLDEISFGRWSLVPFHRGR